MSSNVTGNYVIEPRRIELDWLRVFAFLVLVFYHIGMLYVQGWGFHYKSDYQSSTLASVMLLVNPWRMPLLWFISGVATRYLLAKLGLVKFIAKRSVTLLLPLTFGVLVIVPPQLYVEMQTAQVIDLNYWQFYQLFLFSNDAIFTQYQSGIWPHIDVNHLWYLRELWKFTLLALLFYPLSYLRYVRLPFASFYRLPIFVVVVLLSSVVLVIELWFAQPREAIGLVFFLFGISVAWHEKFWQQVSEWWWYLKRVTPLILVAMVVFYNVFWLHINHYDEAWINAIGKLLYSVARVFGVLWLLSFASRFKTKQTTVLSTLSDAVFPLYLVHQSVIIVVCYWLSDFNLGPWLEPLIVIVLTFSISLVLIIIVKPMIWLRPLWGMKLPSSCELIKQQWLLVISIALILPIALEILL